MDITWTHYSPGLGAIDVLGRCYYKTHRDLTLETRCGEFHCSSPFLEARKGVHTGRAVFSVLYLPSGADAGFFWEGPAIRESQVHSEIGQLTPMLNLRITRGPGPPTHACLRLSQWPFAFWPSYHHQLHEFKNDLKWRHVVAAGERVNGRETTRHVFNGRAIDFVPNFKFNLHCLMKLVLKSGNEMTHRPANVKCYCVLAS